MLAGNRGNPGTLTAAPQQRTPSALARDYLEKAALHCSGEDKTLARVNLALIRLHRADASPRQLLFIDAFLRAGLSPSALQNLLSKKRIAAVFAKYSADQPRVPAGNGLVSGRWTAGGEQGAGQTTRPS